MPYLPIHYANALLQALKERPETENKKLLKDFIVLLRRKRELWKLPAILREAERLLLKERGLAKVKMASASPLSESIAEEIKKALGNIEFHEKTDPALLAGLTILINDDLMVDASARKRIKILF